MMIKIQEKKNPTDYEETTNEDYKFQPESSDINDIVASFSTQPDLGP